MNYALPIWDAGVPSDDLIALPNACTMLFIFKWLWPKNNFYIFKWLGENQKKNAVSWYTLNFSVYKSSFIGARPIIYCLWQLSLCEGKVELLRQRPHGWWRLPGPLQKTCWLMIENKEVGHLIEFYPRGITARMGVPIWSVEWVQRRVSRMLKRVLNPYLVLGEKIENF